VLGRDPATLVGHLALENMHPDDAPVALETLRKVVLEGGSLTAEPFRARAADGSWRWLESRVTNLLDDPYVGAIVVNSRDVTEQHEAQQALREAEERFRALFERLPDGVVLLDPHDPVVPYSIADCNPAFAGMNGYGRDELLGRSIDVLHEEPLVREEPDGFYEWVRREGPGVPSRTTHKRKDGTTFAIDTLSSLITVGGREVVLGVDRDVSDREAALAEVSTILESITDASFSLDLQWRFTRVNASAERLLGLSRESIIGQVFWEEFPDAVGPSFESEYRRAASEKVPVSFEANYEQLEA